MVGQQLESVLVNEYLLTKFRTKPQWKRVRLGQAANQSEAKIYSVTLRWADAIVISEGFVIIIEAKLRPEPGAFGQLENYKKLFPATPEFSQWKDWPIKMVLLTPKIDLNLVELATDKGIDYVVFIPKGWEIK